MTAGTTRDSATLGPYRLVRKLGEGGMGVVHLAMDPAGRPVALKVLRAQVAADEEARRRLAREVVTLRRVRHRLVAEVLDADVVGDEPYIVTRFVPGRSLEDEVRASGPLPAGAVARIGRDLAGALAQIHAAGVVHRDLKPANVMMVDGEPVIIDFGIAHVADESRITRTGLVMGTPGYLSPELIYGDPVTAATDWWAWGATLAFAATGRQPFGTGPVEVILERVRRGACDLDGVEPQLRDVLQRTLAVNPGSRTAGNRLAAELDAVISGVRTAPAAVSQRPAPARYPWEQPTVRQQGPQEAYPQQQAPRPQGPGDQTVRTPPPPRPNRPQPRYPAPGQQPAAAHPRGAPQPGTYPPGAYPPGYPPPAHPGGAYPPGTYAPAAHPGAAQPPAPYAFAPNPSTSRPAAPAPPPATSRRGSAPYQPTSRFAGAGSDADGADDAAGPTAPAGPRRVTGQLAAGIAAVCLVAAVAPGAALVFVVLFGIVARTVQRSVTGLERRRAEIGRSATDVAVTVAVLPWRLAMAAINSLAAAVLPGLVWVSTAFIVASAVTADGTAHPYRPLPLGLGMLAGVATAWWGPGGWSLRTGTRAIVRSASATRGGQLAVFIACAFVAIAVLMVVQQGGTVLRPDWHPFPAPPGLGRLAR